MVGCRPMSVIAVRERRRVARRQRERRARRRGSTVVRRRAELDVGGDARARCASRRKTLFVVDRLRSSGSLNVTVDRGRGPETFAALRTRRSSTRHGRRDVGDRERRLRTWPPSCEAVRRPLPSLRRRRRSTSPPIEHASPATVGVSVRDRSAPSRSVVVGLRRPGRRSRSHCPCAASPQRSPIAGSIGSLNAHDDRRVRMHVRPCRPREARERRIGRVMSVAGTICTRLVDRAEVGPAAGGARVTRLITSRVPPLSSRAARAAARRST